MPPPSPLPAWAATLFSARFNLGREIEHFFTYFYELAQGETPVWRRFVVTVEDMASGDPGDDAKYTIDLVNYTGGAIDTTWTDSDYNTCFTNIEAIAQGWGGEMGNHYVHNRIDAYVMSFNPEWPNSSPGTKLNPFNDSGPPEKTHVMNHGGSGLGGSMPPQCACSVTEIVPVRANWGRFYLPFPTAGFVDTTTGRYKAASIDQQVGNIWAAYETMANAEFFPVVPTTSTNKTRVASLQQVTNVRMDDVPDVIRRRRFQQALYRKTQPPQVTVTTHSPAGS